MAGLKPFAIASLRQRPDLRPVVADRIWRAFWEPYGSPLDVLEAALDEVLAAIDFPFTLVALFAGPSIAS